jgi:dipeptidyl aminopeptidase/acylaminoacyl peptidase
MNETRDLLERVGGRFEFPEEAFDRMFRRRDLKRRNRLIASGLLGLALAIGIVLVLGSVLVRTASQRKPADWPTPKGGAAPFLRPGEVVERPQFGTTLVATDTTTRHQRTLTRCQDCAFISSFAASVDDEWVAWDVVTCGGACTPAKLAKEGIWLAGADGVPHQMVKPCPLRPCSQVWQWSPVASQLAYAQSSGAVARLFLLDPADGARTQIAASEGSITSIAWAPDGRSIAYGVGPLSPPSKPATGSDSSGLYIVRSGARPVRLTEAQVPAGAEVSGVAWSPDGTRLVLNIGQDDREQLVVIGADGTDRRTLVEAPGFEGTGPAVWSPDGLRLAYLDTPGTSGSHVLEVRVVDVDRGRPVRLARIGGSPDAWDGPVWSPDARLVAYAIGDLPKWFSVPADGTGPPRPIDRLEALRWEQA